MDPNFMWGYFTTASARQRSASKATSPSSREPTQEVGLSSRGAAGTITTPPGTIITAAGAGGGASLETPVEGYLKDILSQLDNHIKSARFQKRHDAFVDKIVTYLLGRKWAIQKRSSKTTQNFRRAGFSPCPTSCYLLVCE